MNKCIEELKKIKKDELDERNFYEQIFGALVTLENYELNPHEANELKTILEGIGCVRYDAWKKEKKASGEDILECLEQGGTWEKIGMISAEIGLAVMYIDPLLSSYRDSVVGIEYLLKDDGEGSRAQEWLKNSDEVYREIPKIQEERFNEIIKPLAEIKKSELDERTFYEQVLINIAGLEHVSLNPERAERLKKTLEDIGCVRYDEWEKEKKARGERIPEDSEERWKSADISIAVDFIHQLLGSYETASYGLGKMLEGGDKAGWVQAWLRRSTELKNEEKNVSSEKYSKPAIKSECVEAVKDMGVTKTDILTRGKNLLDRLMQKRRPKDKNQRKDEI